MVALGTVGAQALTILAIFSFILNGYQTFYYYMDALKSLYFERQRSDDKQFEEDWRPLLT